MIETLKKEIVQRIYKNMIDILILRLIKSNSLWGYKIKKEVKALFGLTLRHSKLYPLLNNLEKRGFVTKKNQQKGGRIRIIYSITKKGLQYLDAYNIVLIEQVSEFKPIK